MDCPSCGKAFDLAAWLDNVRSIAPKQKLVWGECPACRAACEFKLEKGRAMMGWVDGGPVGMSFIPEKITRSPVSPRIGKAGASMCATAGAHRR